MFYQTLVTLPTLRMKALLSLLEKVKIQASEKGIDDTTLLAYRLAPDMLPFARQIQIVSDNAKWMASRMAWVEAPKYEDNEKTLDELMARLEKTIAYIATFTEESFQNAKNAEARFPWYPGKKMVGEGYVFTYGLPNFFFHVVTAYDILRHNGFQIGKSDYIGEDVALLDEGV